MYKVTRESKNGLHTSTTTHVRFNDAFEQFIDMMNVHCIENFESFGIPKDSDIKHIGFGLMFWAENEWIDLTMVKTATGDESGSGYVKAINNEMEKDLFKHLNG